MSLPVRARTSLEEAPAATDRRSRSWAARLLIGMLVLLAGLLVWREFEPLLLFRPVDGVVVWSEVEMIRLRGRRGARRTRYAAEVTYRYAVNGERYVSSQYQRTNMVGSRSAASRQARRYVLGTRVPAWYNPLNPADAVLSRAPNPVLPAILGLIGFMVWLFSLASVRRRTPGAAGHRLIRSLAFASTPARRSSVSFVVARFGMLFPTPPGALTPAPAP